MGLTFIDRSLQLKETHKTKSEFQANRRIADLGNAIQNTPRVLYFTDERGHRQQYHYDEHGYLKTITFAQGRQLHYDYAANGRLTRWSNQRGQSTRYTYNAAAQLVQKTRSDGTTIAYQYDEDAGLTAITDAQGTTTLEYGDQGKRLRISYATGRALNYTFNSRGNITQLMVTDQTGHHLTHYTYDARGRLVTITDGVGQLIVRYSYNRSTGLLASKENGNGTVTNYQYDRAGQLIRLENYAGDGAVSSAFQYTYNEQGQRTQVVTLEGVWRYGHDGRGRLTSANFSSTDPSVMPNRTLRYTYDAAGNRTQMIDNDCVTDYSANEFNQLRWAGAANYAYDADGNLTSQDRDGTGTTYIYDEDNRLVRVSEPDGSVTEYEYDVFGHRCATICNGRRVEYLVNPLGVGDVLAEYGEAGQLICRYTHGMGLVSRHGHGQPLPCFFDFDALGSTVGLTNAVGEVVNRYGYLPFGGLLFEREAVANRFKFVGQYGITAEDHGLHYMRARFYDGEVGRFIAQDPLGIQGGTNLYAYVENAPLDWIDPTGLVPQGENGTPQYPSTDPNYYHNHPDWELDTVYNSAHGENPWGGEQTVSFRERSGVSGRDYSGGFGQITFFDDGIYEVSTDGAPSYGPNGEELYKKTDLLDPDWQAHVREDVGPAVLQTLLATLGGLSGHPGFYTNDGYGTIDGDPLPPLTVTVQNPWGPTLRHQTHELYFPDYIREVQNDDLGASRSQDAPVAETVGTDVAAAPQRLDSAAVDNPAADPTYVDTFANALQASFEVLPATVTYAQVEGALLSALQTTLDQHPEVTSEQLEDLTAQAAQVFQSPDMVATTQSEQLSV